MNFFKYSSTGNDFILIDNRTGTCAVADKKYWQNLCERRLNIGADGVIFLEKSDRADFHMRYLNADGAEVSMCGNGTRAISHFYKFLTETKKEKLTFSTANGLYEAHVDGDFVWVNMTEAYDVESVDNRDLYNALDSYYMNTGVPHCIYLVENVEKVDVGADGARIRYDKRFDGGVNVNFISKTSNGYKVRTYERGVENETLSCGTGITASAHFLWNRNIVKENKICFESLGGELTVKREGDSILFGGLTRMIYKGEIC